MAQYQPKTGIACNCKPGIYRDNCPICEGTGMVIDFKAIREMNNRKQETNIQDVQPTERTK